MVLTPNCTSTTGWTLCEKKICLIAIHTRMADVHIAAEMDHTTCGNILYKWYENDPLRRSRSWTCFNWYINWFNQSEGNAHDFR